MNNSKVLPNLVPLYASTRENILFFDSKEQLLKKNSQVVGIMQ
jgi:hypothetical protein